MPPELVTQLLNVVSGSFFLALCLATVWQIWRFRKPDGRIDRGLVMKTEPVESHLVAGLRRMETERAAWGWTRREGEALLVFADPYYTGDGHMRIETPWPYVAEVRFDAESAVVAYRAPTLPMLTFGVISLPFLVPVINHAAMVGRLQDRLRRLASE